jgi:hypothetical protein
MKMATGSCIASRRTAVFDRIQQSPLKPTGLLGELGTEYSYTDIQDALSDLLESGDVVLMPDLTLKPAPSPESVEER